MEAIYRDYHPKGVKFFYIYKTLAHPGNNGYVSPFDHEERLRHVTEIKEKLGSDIPWLCDNMSNDFKHAMGNAPNSEFIIDPKGKIVRSRSWCSPSELREDLAELVGEVKPETAEAQVGMSPLDPPKTAATGIVPRLKLEGRMTALEVVSRQNGGEPFFAKLRVEADESLLKQGDGQLYLGLFLDPLYEVHWNNHVGAPEVEITVRQTEVTPDRLRGPAVEEPSDADPREFLVAVKDGQPGETIFDITVKYVACDDKETFCKPVTQEYQIKLARDADGGSRRDAMPRSPNGRRARQPQMQDLNLQRARTMFHRMDMNRDGVIQKQEARGPLQWADLDEDGEVTREEWREFMRRR